MGKFGYQQDDLGKYRQIKANSITANTKRAAAW
jgi:hypothetical protein